MGCYGHCVRTRTRRADTRLTATGTVRDQAVTSINRTLTGWATTSGMECPAPSPTPSTTMRGTGSCADCGENTTASAPGSECQNSAASSVPVTRYRRPPSRPRGHPGPHQQSADQRLRHVESPVHREAHARVQLMQPAGELCRWLNIRDPVEQTLGFLVGRGAKAPAVSFRPLRRLSPAGPGSPADLRTKRLAWPAQRHGLRTATAPASECAATAGRSYRRPSFRCG
jgi:hypothetical protein